MHLCLHWQKSFITHKKLHSHESKCHALAQIESNLAHIHKHPRITSTVPPEAHLIPDEIHASVRLSSNPKPVSNAACDEAINFENNMIFTFSFIYLI